MGRFGGLLRGAWVYGLENLSFIPGEVGASAVQNIGAYGAEVKDVITAVETVGLQDGEVGCSMFRHAVTLIGKYL